MKKRILIVILSLVLLILAVGTPYLIHNYLFLNGTIYPKNLETLDLSGAPLEDQDRFSGFTQLKQLDLRNTQITAAEYENIQKQLPGCQIQWLVPFQGNYLPLDTTNIAISSITEEEMALLAYLPQLETVDATACQDYDALLQLQAMYPNSRVLYQLTLDGVVLAQDASVADLPNASAESVAQALAYLPGLNQVNAQGCRDYEALLQLQAEYPDCSIHYTVSCGGAEWAEDTTDMQLHAATPEELSQVLPYLPALQDVTIMDPMADPDGMLALREAYPQISFTYYFPLLETTVCNRDSLVDISGTVLENTQALEAALPHFINLEKVDMCGCGIADEDMAALNEKYPDTLFVWEIYFGRKSVRTDATYFMPYQLDYEVTDADADKLKYLTELICIDLGHMPISRSDFLHYMPKMKYLLLGVTKISDISGCANMPDLIYAEFFMSKVKDFTPLLECKKLVDLNVSYTKSEDPLVLCQMTQLENLWYRGLYNKAAETQLREALPNTTMIFTGGSSTDEGWRHLQNYYDMRDLLGMWYMEG